MGDVMIHYFSLVCAAWIVGILHSKTRQQSFSYSRIHELDSADFLFPRGMGCGIARDISIQFHGPADERSRGRKLHGTCLQSGTVLYMFTVQWPHEYHIHRDRHSHSPRGSAAPPVLGRGWPDKGRSRDVGRVQARLQHSGIYPADINFFVHTIFSLPSMFLQIPAMIIIAKSIRNKMPGLSLWTYTCMGLSALSLMVIVIGFAPGLMQRLLYGSVWLWMIVSAIILWKRDGYDRQDQENAAGN